MSGIKTKPLSFIFIFWSLSIFSCDRSTHDIHLESFVADTHNDVLLRAMEGQNVLKYHPESHSDLEKFKLGGVDLQVFSIWVSPDEKEKKYFENANDMINKLDFLISRVPKDWGLAKSYQDITYNSRKNKMSCVIGVEGGHIIGRDISKLEALHDRGMRYLGLTWNNSNHIASSAKDETFNRNSLSNIGLSNFGSEVIQKCNDLGVIIDVSHAGEQAFWDVVEQSQEPIIASHSSVYALCPHYRNLKDDQIKAIAKTGGAVFINFYPGYIDSTFQQKAEIINMKYEVELDILAEKYDPLSNQYWFEEMKLLKHEKARIAPSINDVIKHISYIVDLVGVDYVGIGSDYDGVEIMPTGLENVSKLPFLTKKLIEHGYTIREVRKILGGNFKRIFKEVCK
ncbi:MAG: dipeptidase [Candidatus Neomarinimicrobiota bacterium]